jgi:hypothetical protein
LADGKYKHKRFYFSKKPFEVPSLAFEALTLDISDIELPDFDASAYLF